MTILVDVDNFGLAHRRLIESLLQQGKQIPTDYDKPGEPLSRDAPVVIEIHRPWDPPVFSRCIWSSYGKAFEYVREIVDGIHDGQVKELAYTYHARMRHQWPGVTKELKRNPATRRAQCTTWRPGVDLGALYPPCLQRVWLRVVYGRLDMHTHWRSRDALKAWGLNAFAFAHLHKQRAELAGIEIGVYREFIDSCHIYGRDIELARQLIANRPTWQVSLVDMKEIIR